MDPATMSRLVALLERARASLDDAERFSYRRGHDCRNAIEDGQERVADALALLRAELHAFEQDLDTQAAQQS